MNYLAKRLTEGSTWGGLGLITFGLGNLFQINEAPAIAEAVGQGGQVIVETGNWQTGLLTILFGVVGAFIKDKD